MRRGQAGLEYVIIIGTVAAGLIAMIFYVSRSHQGNLRSQANRLSESQYAPGKTEIHINERKQLNSTLDVTGIGSTLHSENPQGQINPAVQGDPNADPDSPEGKGYLGQYADTQKSLYEAVTNWELAVVQEALDEAARVRKGAWEWVRPPVPTKIIEDVTIPPLLVALKDLTHDLADAKKAWKDREKDKTSPGSPVRTEDGTKTKHKTINEALGTLGKLGEE